MRKPDALFEHIVDASGLRRRTTELHATRGWNWESTGRLWPYLHLKWMLAQDGAAK
jgi:asparagine synthase (glutamine-hydrolysing)